MAPAWLQFLGFLRGWHQATEDQFVGLQRGHVVFSQQVTLTRSRAHSWHLSWGMLTTPRPPRCLKQILPGGFQ